ncbi:CLUMA_CG019248, isoform A [Clunio marinus]|uniref:CLUMA_CG019248, isoform A n=1 Tax=Clunio marinus TaxID=568069 RepID=A0A1J1J293_9DIPT|nr:CLUMA_CG019248, isoform A [Clunio marinus]
MTLCTMNEIRKLQHTTPSCYSHSEMSALMEMNNQLNEKIFDRQQKSIKTMLQSIKMTERSFCNVYKINIQK